MVLKLVFLACTLGATVYGAPAPETDDKGQIWAVLVAGSNGYDNYRHQADVSHAYQIFHRHGVPDSNIIVMMYDDIARNKDNPNKGVIINKPGGPNVYKGVVKDYTKDDVNPKNFVKVLTGDKEGMMGKGSGKVLQSGPNDHVFVNFVDHGADGLIGFPNDVMYADDLIKALKTMHQKKMYKKLVFYLEACESGSMFNKILPKNIEIFATTAANPDESSYACYWDEALNTFLGDEYSISWMEDIDSEEGHKNLTTETLIKQFHNVVKRVNESHPQMYGQKSLKSDHVADYVGGEKSILREAAEDNQELARFEDAVSSRDVALETLNRKILLSKDLNVVDDLKKKRDALIQGRKEVDSLFSRILDHVTGVDREEVEDTHQPLSLEMMDCYRTLVDNFSNTCVNINKNTYALSHLYKLANLCTMTHFSPADVLKAFSTTCSPHHRAMTGIN